MKERKNQEGMHNSTC